ncbi:MAG: hypothetical protein ACJAWL_003023 [Motiliproteus sp.]|jgi:hypothetical protein
MTNHPKHHPDLCLSCLNATGKVSWHRRSIPLSIWVNVQVSETTAVPVLVPWLWTFPTKCERCASTRPTSLLSLLPYWKGLSYD